jgi:hypothetical protein
VSRRPALGLAALLLVAGLVVSRPLASECTRGLPLTAGAPTGQAVLSRTAGDTLQLYYQLWLVRDGLLGPTPLFRDPYQFRLNGPRWNLPQSFLPLAVPFVLLSGFGSHAAYNLLVLLVPAGGLAAMPWSGTTPATRGCGRRRHRFAGRLGSAPLQPAAAPRR